MSIEEDAYKEVHLGSKKEIIPRSWKVLSISDIGKVVTGTTPSKSKNEYWGGENLFVTPTDIGENKYIRDTEAKITDYGLSEAKPIPPGSVMVTCIASIGKNALNKKEVVTNQQINSLICGQSYNSDYYYYLIGYRTPYLKALAGQTSVPIVNKSEFKSFEVIAPPNSEQKKIAEILSTVDEAIQKTEEIIERTKELKKGLMQDLLTKGIGHEEFKEVQLGPRKLKIPTEWKTSNLKDVAEIINGSTPSKRKEEFWSGDIVFITPTDITENGSKYISNSKEKITEEGLNSCSTHLLEPGAVLMTSRATIGEASINKIPVCTNQGFKNLVTGEKLYNEYLYYYIPLIKDYLNDIGGGSTFPEINKKDTETIRIPLPPLPEQKKIANILSKVDQKIQKEKDYKEKLEELKKGLMQDLLTGKVRVLPLLSEEEKEELKEADVPG